MFWAANSERKEDIREVLWRKFLLTDLWRRKPCSRMYYAISAIIAVLRECIRTSAVESAGRPFEGVLQKVEIEARISSVRRLVVG